MAIPAFITIDRWGRRTLCLLTTPLLGLCMFAAGLCFNLEKGSTAYLGTIFLFMFLFTALYPPGKAESFLCPGRTNDRTGLGVVPYTYSAEVFPTVNRGKLILSSTHTSANHCTRGRHVPRCLCEPLRRRGFESIRSFSSKESWSHRFIRVVRVSFHIPYVHGCSCNTLTYYSISGLNLLAFILMFIFLYETKQERLESLDKICKLYRFQVHLGSIPRWIYHSSTLQSISSAPYTFDTKYLMCSLGSFATCSEAQRTVNPYGVSCCGKTSTVTALLQSAPRTMTMLMTS
jgi:hypothetical protein